MDMILTGSKSKPIRRLPAEGGRGSPTGTPWPSSGAKRLAMSGHPRSTHPAIKGSAANSARDSRNERHAVGLTKTRSWRRGFSLARLDGEIMNALLNVSGFGTTASLLAECIAPITVLATLVQQRLQLFGKRALLVPRGEDRPGLR